VTRDEGFTLVEMLAVLVIMATLLAIAIGFNAAARVRSADASAKSNIDVAVPAFSAYALDNGGFDGMTLLRLQTTYSRGITNITIVSADPTTYCVSSTVEGRTWYKLGPGGSITTARCR
jgi:prepilin-type N-terminal cleavage/methylation domain-containing protein